LCLAVAPIPWKAATEYDAGKPMIDFAQARRMMVDCQVRTYDVTDRAVLAALDEVPREKFVPADRVALVYSDQPIPLTSGVPQGGRVLLAPMVLARLLQALEAAPGEAVLDVGCGTGYSTAVLARIGAYVTGLEPDAGLASIARRLLAEVVGHPVTVAEGPAGRGAAQFGPYDAILVNGSFEIRPDGLLDQLKENGRLVGIEGIGRATKAVIYRRADGTFGARSLFDATAPVFADLKQTFAFAL